MNEFELLTTLTFKAILGYFSKYSVSIYYRPRYLAINNNDTFSIMESSSLDFYDKFVNAK